MPHKQKDIPIENLLERELHIYLKHRITITEDLVSEPTKWQHVRIAKSEGFGKILLLNGIVQSTEKDEFIYHEALVHPALSRNAKAKKVLILGGAEGCVLREAAKYGNVENITMIDIDGHLIRLCRNHLPEFNAGAFREPRLRLRCTEAGQYLRNSGEIFDVIIDDLSELSPPIHLFAQRAAVFYQHIAGSLSENGIYCAQLHSIAYPDEGLSEFALTFIKQYLPYILPYRVFIPSFSHYMCFILASKNKIGKPRQTLAMETVKKLKFYSGKMDDAMFTLPKTLAKFKQ